MKTSRTDRIARSIDRRRSRTRRKGPQHALVAVLILVPVLLILLVSGLVPAGLYLAGAFGRDIPRLDEQGAVTLAETSRIYAADGTLLAYLHGVENRTVIGGERIPQVMKNAIVASEDRRFYEHSGVDFEGFMRALVMNIDSGEIVEGFSTITMQLVGNLYLDRSDISLSRKFAEAALAWQTEEKMSKDEILDQYLNTVYFGSNAYGVEAASNTYFDKDPEELTLPEAALLAGLVQAPSAYSPRRNPVAALNRRNAALADMLDCGFITQKQFEKALKTPMDLAPSSPYQKVQEPYVVAYVRKQLIDMFGEDEVFKGGLTVETTILPHYQKIAQDAISSTLDQEGDPSAALVAIESRTGYIRAMVGGTDYVTSKFNYAAQGRRQPGSAFKTFVLSAAVEQGINPYTTVYASQPVSLDIPGSREPWNVNTFSGQGYGPSTIAQATLRSDNTVFAQLALDVTPEAIVDVARRMGITSTLNPNPAIALGGLTYGVSPLEMASAYSTLANMGTHVQPAAILRVRNAKGEVLYEARPKEAQAISQGVAYVVNGLLESNVKSGTGWRARLDRPAAGKTGTAQDYHDAWFCGYIPQVSTAVWVGHPDAQIPMTNVHGMRVTGGSFPTIIWEKFMSEIIADYPAEDFPEPNVEVKWDYSFKSTHGAEPTTTTSSTSSTTTTTLDPSTTTTQGTTPTTKPGTTTTRTTSTTKPPTTTTIAPPTSTSSTSTNTTSTPPG